MFRSILGRNLTQRVSTYQSSQQIFRSTFVRFNSDKPSKNEFQDIFNTPKQEQPSTETETTITTTTTTTTPKQQLNIDDLLNSSVPNTEKTFGTFPTKFSLHDKFGFEKKKQPSPREVAKNIRLFGTNAGRTVDVSYKNISRSLNQIKRVVNDNKIRYLQRIQSRYIRPAKYRKQLKREWWRRRFAAGFKGLLHQVNDARRRGY